ncbi:hypothetical protein [Wolbachia endosymbiont of Dirofilaria (Dirofilaria) immitis]|uniref:hypothetical protein n=1 Tax=Wolbachia endosymbiont of Dirofilaria (Dirofilaria) immitis TaxID=1812115 RepID=UPI00158A82A8|nr:hypothetical protein [Wolbachia endosymbiont of Dirofilaria (Dirofilaria) immitis]QKX02576.1 hypothetical protein GOY12_03470 [Wolbachia endosymbiont of Dirofilaria (Dirofilaria) immitis]
MNLVENIGTDQGVTLEKKKWLLSSICKVGFSLIKQSLYPSFESSLSYVLSGGSLYVTIL